MFKMEEWRPVKDYEGYYEVSNLGNIRRVETYIRYKNTDQLRKYPSKVLKQEKCDDGYKRVVLMKEGIKERRMSHRVVAESFIPNILNKPFVNHINGVKNDNRIENLEWCTQSDNERHSIESLGKNMQGKTNPQKVKRVETNEVFNSYRSCVENIQGTACIEGLKKAIAAKRLYHGFTYEKL